MASEVLTRTAFWGAERIGGRTDGSINWLMTRIRKVSDTCEVLVVQLSVTLASSAVTGVSPANVGPLGSNDSQDGSPAEEYSNEPSGSFPHVLERNVT